MNEDDLLNQLEAAQQRLHRRRKRDDMGDAILRAARRDRPRQPGQSKR